MKRIINIALAILLTSASFFVYGSEPRASLKYKRDLIRHSQNIIGLDAPIPLFAAQIHQESAWNFKAKSKYAAGLTQFTPSTADWIAEVFPVLERANVYNPVWAIRAMIYYNDWLSKRIDARNSCDKWAMILSAYNGGLGWVYRDKKLAKSNGKDNYLWWDNVELYSNRADWAFEENRHYPQRIIYKHQSKYKLWGRSYVC